MTRRKRRGYTPHPNGEMTTEASVPLGMPVLTRAYAHFNGSNYLTINKAQTIGVEYPDNPHFECLITPATPEDAEETLYGIDTGSAFLKIDASLNLLWSKNGPLNKQHPNKLNDGASNKVQMWFKLGFGKIVLNGISFEFSATWDETTWESFSIGSRTTGSLYLTGTMHNITADGDDGLESWPLNGNLNGSLAVAHFNGNGYADFPQQFDISENEDFRVDVLMDVTSTYEHIGFMGDNESNQDRFYFQNATNQFKLYLTNGEIVFNSTTATVGLGKVLFSCERIGTTYNIYHDNVLIQSRPDSGAGALRIDNFGWGYTTGGNIGFKGAYYGTKITVEGELVLDHKPKLGGGFYDAVTETNSVASGTGTTFGNDAVLTGSTEAELFDNETGYSVKKSRYVGNFDGADNLTFDLEIGNDFELEICDFTPLDLSVRNWLFAQYSGANPARFRVEIESTTKRINVQIGGVSNLFTQVLIEDRFYKSIKFTKAGANITIDIDGVSDLQTGYGTPQTGEPLEFGRDIDGTRDLTALVGGLKVNGQTFPINQESGNTINGSEGNIATLTDASPISFWLKTLVPV